MICEKAGCKKEAKQRLNIIKKETKERYNYSLCWEHYIDIRLKRVEQALIVLWIDDREEEEELTHKGLLKGIDYFGKKAELIKLWDEIYLEED